MTLVSMIFFSLRSHIGIVLQDVFLFSGTIADNITLRNVDIPRSKVEEVAKMLGIHDFIMRLPGGYDFNVMERGNTLFSGTAAATVICPCATL